MIPISTLGYKSYSPDVNNQINIIPSKHITMSGVLFDVIGIDNLGNVQIMHPEFAYLFEGDYVIEFPLKNTLTYLY